MINNYLPEFKGQIIDIFEDYLCDKNQTLVNTDRLEAITSGEIDEEDAAIIYGQHYDMIGDEIEYLVGIDAINDEVTVEVIDKLDDKFAEKIIDKFIEVLADGQCDLRPSYTDLNDLNNKIKSLIQTWRAEKDES